MTDAEQNPPELEIKSDEDWKSRVKEEAAQLDAEMQAKSADAPPSEDTQESNPASPPPIDETQLPPPEFATLVSLFSTQAMVALGLIPSPADGKAEKQLPLARHFIDMLGVLEEKTKGNLSEAEAGMLEQSLHELRMAYVELSRAS